MIILLLIAFCALAFVTAIYDIAVRLFLYFAKNYSFSQIRTMPHETCELLPIGSVARKIHCAVTVIHYGSLAVGAILLVVHLVSRSM